MHVLSTPPAFILSQDQTLHQNPHHHQPTISRPVEAQKYSREALKLGTRDPLKLFHAGMIAKSLGQKERAREYLQQAVGLNPHFSLLYSGEAADALKSLKSEED